ncbi:MAG: hypothetical protein D6719_02045 [Candidatus Dadabacteria bacterium]|nr:MAG: hypothetical protein D6719_02045 [Candidatus Dadabacteria bacterium]
MNALNPEICVGNLIEKRQTYTWRWPSATNPVPRDALYRFSEVPEEPSFGDVAIVRVESIGKYTFVENRTGCQMKIFPGTIMLGVFSTRYAPDEWEALLPERVYEGAELHLLNRGGTLGVVTSINSGWGAPTTVKVLAFARNKNDQIVNTKDYGIESHDRPPLNETEDPKLILVVGSSMNAGKSNAAKSVVYSLTAAGYRVFGGKVTGTAARRDALLMRAAGALGIIDFTDFGYPSTYLLPEDELNRLFWRMYNYFRKQAGPDGYIVFEIADGILQRETAMLLANPDIRKKIHKLVFACSDPLSALAGVELLNERYNLDPAAIVGRVANSDLGIRELRSVVDHIPVLNSMVIDVEGVLDAVA